MDIAAQKKIVWLPDAQQELLLVAALETNRAEALAAWEKWRQMSACASVCAAENRLLPLVYRNLRADEQAVGDFNRLKHAHRETFRQNQIMFGKMRALLRLFEPAGIPFILLKGAAISVLHYKSAALRPMSDIDLLVPPNAVPRAIEILQQNNFRLIEDNIKLQMTVAPSVSLVGEDELELDLHWHLLRDCWSFDRVDEFWTAAVEFDFGAVRARALSPTHQFFHVCCHGAKWNPLPSVRWVADATVILRESGAQIDWSEIVRLARLHGVCLQLAAAFDYLRRKFAAAIPLAIVTELQTAPISWQETLAFRLQSQNDLPPWSVRRWSEEFIFRYSTLTSHTHLRPRFLVFIKYLQHSLQLSSQFQIPSALIGELWRRFVWRRQSEGV